MRDYGAEHDERQLLYGPHRAFPEGRVLLD